MTAADAITLAAVAVFVVVLIAGLIRMAVEIDRAMTEGNDDE